MNIFVIDVGTSSIRGILYDQHAKVVHQEQISYTPNYLTNGWVEQDPVTWENGLICLCRSLSDYCQNGIEIPSAISLTAQRSSVIPLDSKGIPLSHAIMWQDKRTIPYVKSLTDYDDLVFSTAGSHINPVFSACKMSWIHQNQPELYKKTFKLAVIPDYLLSIMIGKLYTDQTYGSRSLLMNLRSRSWDPELIRIFGLSEDKLCPLIAPGSIAGTTTKDFSALTGLPTGIPVISAGGDQQCGALGLGVINQGDMEISLGTGAYILADCKQLPSSLQSDVICGASAVPGRYVLESSILTCCSAFDWFYRTFYSESKDAAYQLINAELATSPAGSHGILALPYFQGRATPDWNSEATASFLNLSLSTTRGDLARALLEGICYEVNCNIRGINNYTGKIRKIQICGGLTQNPVFNQMQSDIYGYEVKKFSNSEATALGAFISAAVSIGVCSDYAAAFQLARHNDSLDIYKPNDILAYKEGYKEFLRNYSLLYPGK